MRNVFSLVPDPNAETLLVETLPGDVGDTPGAALMKSNMLKRRTGIVLKGDVSHKDFWSFHVETGRERLLTSLRRGSVIGDFDISPDGREIIFDRTREESDVVLFDLPAR